MQTTTNPVPFLPIDLTIREDERVDTAAYYAEHADHMGVHAARALIDFLRKLDTTEAAAGLSEDERLGVCRAIAYARDIAMGCLGCNAKGEIHDCLRGVMRCSDCGGDGVATDCWACEKPTDDGRGRRLDHLCPECGEAADLKADEARASRKLGSA